MPAAQEKHSKPGPLKLVTPPNPFQRPTGTSASNSMASASCAMASVLGQSIFKTPGRVEIAQPRSRLEPKVPSLSLRSLYSGLVFRPCGSAFPLPCMQALPAGYPSCRRYRSPDFASLHPGYDCFTANPPASTAERSVGTVSTLAQVQQARGGPADDQVQIFFRHVRDLPHGCDRVGIAHRIVAPHDQPIGADAGD